MKRLFTLLVVFVSLQADAQTTLVAWNFPNNPDDAIADGGITANAAKTISLTGTNVLSFSTGASTYAASATGWTSGSGSKYWEISFSTVGYASITISSKQRSSGTGPADFKLQYKVGSGGTYTDVTNGDITVADNFTGGVLSGLALPSAVDNNSNIFVRWIMTSNTSVSAGTVAGIGTSRIDDIVVQATSAVPLPLRLVSFEGKPETRGILLQWSAACETSLNAYEVQKSADGIAFSKVASVPARNGGCGVEAAYAYEDVTPEGNVVYRLRIEDDNGAFVYSPVRSFHNSRTQPEVHVSPNPAGGELHVEGLEAGTQWRITDGFGQVIAKGNATQYSTDISLDNLSCGMYFLQYACGQTIRFVKQ